MRIGLNIKYLRAFIAIFIIEAFIAVYVHDDFIRPYVGDVLVVVLIYCFIKAFVRSEIKLLPLYIFVFAALVEIGQLFNLAELLGPGNYTIARIIIGSTFDIKDIVCYLVGCGGLWLFETEILYNTSIERNIVIKRRQTEEINANEYVIKRPLFLPVFLLIMFLMSLLVCFLDKPSIEVKDSIDIIAVGFYLIAGFSIWIPITVITFILLVINFYIYFRFKLVIHVQSFSVTPLLGATHDVAFSSVEKVTHSKRFSKKGYYIDIEYDNKKIHIPYSLNMKGRFKQKSFEVLLKKFENYKAIIITED